MIQCQDFSSPRAACVRFRPRWALAIAVGAATVFVGQAPRAQEAATPGDGPVLLDEINVTARRFEERAIDAPVSVTVTTEDDIERERVRDAVDLSERTPNFVMPSFGDDPRTAAPIIRGVGALASVLAPDNSTVPFFVDGAPLTGFGAAPQLLDTEQVEVLRGPQGTLFGRNSTAGAVTIRSRRPDGVREFETTTELGTDLLRTVEAKGGGTLIDGVLFGRAAIRYTGQNDFIENRQPGQNGLGGTDVGAARGSLAWVGADDRELVISATLEIDRSDVGYVGHLDTADVFQNNPDFHRDLIGVTANYEQELSFAELFSTTSYQYYNNTLNTDNTDGFLFGAFLGQPPEVFVEDGELNFDQEKEHQVYQEVRLQSPVDSALRWTGGLVGTFNDFEGEYRRRSSLFPTSTGDRDNKITTYTLAAFGDITAPVTDTVEASVGLRYTYEHESYEEDFIGDGTPSTVARFSADDSKEFNLVTARASLSWKPTDTVNLYASAARGAKGGGFSRYNNNVVFGVAEEGFDDTTVMAYEVGAKAELLDRRVALGIAGFFNDISDEAILGFDNANFTFPVENLDLETSGVEVDATVVVTDQIRVLGGFGFTESEIVGVPTETGTGGREGNEVPNVPRFTGSLSLDVSDDFDVVGSPSPETLFARLSYRYMSDRPADVANSYDLDEQNVVDARAGMEADGFSVFIFGTNLIGDELEGQGVQLSPGVRNILLSRGRTVGVGASLRF